MKTTNNKIQRLLIGCWVMIFFSAMSFAQNRQVKMEAEPTPYNFAGIQGGVQNTLNRHFNNRVTFTPTATLVLGRFFNPVFGARLTLNGIYNKGTANHLDPNRKGDHFWYSYITPNVDALLNIRGLLGERDYRPLHYYLIAGLGLYRAWDNDEALGLQNSGFELTNAEVATRNALNGRIGLQFEWDMTRRLAFNLEGTYNIHAGQPKSFAKDNHQFVLQAGLTFKFGPNHHRREVVYIEENNNNIPPVLIEEDKDEQEVWELRQDTIWYEEDAFTNHFEDGSMTWNVFYDIRKSDYSDVDAQLAKIGAFLKEHRECKVTVKSYADRGTGNPVGNVKYSQQRNEKAVKALIEAGVSPNIISASFYGDTVQPFKENDKNRVTIITATGLKNVRDKHKVKKFRIEEKRVKVSKKVGK